MAEIFRSDHKITWRKKTMLNQKGSALFSLKKIVKLGMFVDNKWSLGNTAVELDIHRGPLPAVARFPDQGL